MRSGFLMSLLVIGFSIGCNMQDSTETASTDDAPPPATGRSAANAAMGAAIGLDPGALAPPTTPPVTPPQTGFVPPAQTPQQPAMQPPAQGAAQPSLNLPPALRPVVPGSPANGEQKVRAGVGVGKQGRSLDNMSGVIVQPAKSLFAFKERAVFQFQIPQAMQLFAATNGRKPKSHDEFMASIIKANNIQLPTLPQGQRYQFDVQSGELMVCKPRQ